MRSREGDEVNKDNTNVTKEDTNGTKEDTNGTKEDTNGIEPHIDNVGSEPKTINDPSLVAKLTKAGFKFEFKQSAPIC